jgi:hypothetical protein
MVKRVFLSFHMADKMQVDNVRRQKWNAGFPLEYFDGFVRPDFRSKQAEELKASVIAKIEGSFRTICFMGAMTHQCPWVKFELEKTIECGKEILLMGLPNGQGRPMLPNIVSRKEVMPWNIERFRRYTE